MADNRKVIHGVWVDEDKNRRLITDVQELAEVMTPELQERLEAAGSISGEWGEAKAKKAEPLDDLTVVELKDKARDAGIEGFSTMNKADLIAALSMKE